MTYYKKTLEQFGGTVSTLFITSIKYVPKRWRIDPIWDFISGIVNFAAKNIQKKQELPQLRNDG